MHFTPPAYLDPGSGSIIWQIIIAVVLGTGMVVRVFWGNIKRLLGIKSTPDEDADNE